MSNSYLSSVYSAASTKGVRDIISCIGLHCLRHLSISLAYSYISLLDEKYIDLPPVRKSLILLEANAMVRTLMRQDLEALGMSRNWLIALGISLSIIALIFGANAKCPASGCSGGSPGNWDASAQAFLNSDVPIVGRSIQETAEGSSLKVGPDAENSTPKNSTLDENEGNMVPRTSMNDVQPAYRSNLFPKGEFLKAMPGVSSSDLVLDVSDSNTQGEARIRDAVRIPSKSFLYENGTLRPVSEMPKILGDAGISRSDPVVVYNDAFDSGEATFVFWLMRYLGHEDVKVLDGDLYDWTAASLPLDTKQNSHQAVNYTAAVKADLLANYEQVKSGAVQVVDARSFQEYGKGRIQKAFFISPEEVLADGKIKDASGLNDTFAKLDKSKPVVVYSSDIPKASLVWYALQLMGFDSRIYTWQDWQEHEQPKAYEIK